MSKIHVESELQQPGTLVPCGEDGNDEDAGVPHTQPELPPTEDHFSQIAALASPEETSTHSDEAAAAAPVTQPEVQPAEPNVTAPVPEPAVAVEPAAAAALRLRVRRPTCSSASPVGAKPLRP